MPALRSRKLTLRLSEDEFRRWDRVRRSFTDGEVVPSHADALMLVLELAEEASPGRIGRLTERWRSRDPRPGSGLAHPSPDD